MARDKRAIVVWTASAARDFDQAYEFLSRGSKRKALAFVRDVQRATNKLEFDPEIGPAAEDLDPAGAIRSLPCRPHRVLYRYDGTTAFILRVWDNRRDPESFAVSEADDAPEGEPDEQN